MNTFPNEGPSEEELKCIDEEIGELMKATDLSPEEVQELIDDAKVKVKL